MGEMPTEKKAPGPASFTFFWIAVLYVSQGFPFGVINDAVPIAFRQNGVSLEKIGLLSLVGLPWTLKFLWAPAVDIFGRRRHWIIACQFLLAAGLVVLATGPQGTVTPLTWAVLVALAVFSATQDIAIDAYSIELLEPKQIGIGNGIRVSAYRVALILAGGVLVGISGVLGWVMAEGVAAGLLLLLALAVCFAPDPVRPRPAADPSQRDTAWKHFEKFFKTPTVIAVLVFILIFKLGDQAMAPMTKPFLVDRGLTSAELALLLGTFGIAATILGALLGGMLTSRLGIFHALWVLGLFQAVSNLGYVGATLCDGKWVLWGAALFEAFCGGLGTAAFLAFLMSICDKKFAATQYALLSALFGLGRSLAGAASGYGARHFGYGNYFAITFLLAIPAFALLPMVRKWMAGQEKVDPKVSELF
jgi:PAT family beta-lactamase induction signal transducer AmpG